MENNKEFGYLPLADPEFLRIAIALEKMCTAVGGDVTAIAIENAAAAAQAALEAEKWARGTEKGEPVAEDDETRDNNSKYYAENAAFLVNSKLAEIAAAVEAADDAIARLDKQVGYAWFSVHNDDGEIYVTVISQWEDIVKFSVNEQTGELLVTVEDQAA